MSFLSEFDKAYSHKLQKRAGTFRKIFELLESKHKDFYFIVETGCIRSMNNMAGDGSSTFLFDRFVNTHNGVVNTVDINPNHCAIAQNNTSEKTVVHCANSVSFLWNFSPEKDIDLLYLDSFDIDVRNPHPSMIHHMNEFCAILPKLNSETLIVVDDQFVNEKVGKGKYIKEFMDNIGKKPFIDDYQIGWVL